MYILPFFFSCSFEFEKPWTKALSPSLGVLPALVLESQHTPVGCKLSLCCTQKCWHVIVSQQRLQQCFSGVSITVYIRKSGRVAWLAGEETLSLCVIVCSGCWVLSVNSLSDSQHAHKYRNILPVGYSDLSRAVCLLTSGETTESLVTNCY